VSPLLSETFTAFSDLFVGCDPQAVKKLPAMSIKNIFFIRIVFVFNLKCINSIIAYSNIGYERNKRPNNFMILLKRNDP